MQPKVTSRSSSGKWEHQGDVPSLIQGASKERLLFELLTGLFRVVFEIVENDVDQIFGLLSRE